MAENNGGTIITRKGLQLIAKLVAGEKQLVFSKVKVGTGLPEDKNPYDFTDLIHYKMDGMIAEYGFDEETQNAYVVMQISNNNVSQSFVMTEIGLYAQDLDNQDILYAYVDLSDDPNYIMAMENGRMKTVQIKLHVIVGEATNITAIINPLSQVTRKEFDKVTGQLLDRIIAIENIINGISYHEELETISIPELFAGDGTVNLPSAESMSYILPTAKKDRLGGVKIGQGIDVAEDGTISTDISTSAEKAAAMIEANTEGFSDEEIKALF